MNVKPMVKQPDKTRKSILEAAFWEIYRNGFQTASIDRILDGTGLTKGALYYHFPNKLELGYAVVDEVIRPWLLDTWLQALDNTDDPVDGIRQAVVGGIECHPEEMMLGGCPLFNLTQEMSNVDEGFRSRLEGVLNDWRNGIAGHLANGQARGLVRTDLDPEATAAFLVASFEGIAGTAKGLKDREFAEKLLQTFLTLVETLRPVPQPGQMA